MPLPQNAIAHIVRVALEEDLGRGDITTEACVDPEVRGRAQLAARQSLVFCGAPIVREVFRQVDYAVRVAVRCQEGERLKKGDVALTISGPASSILKGERVALNFVQHLSGVATLTRAYVDRVPEGNAAHISDTRKTTPGLRILERYAVRCGGGRNHRGDLSAAILIKDNHIAVCGGVRQAVQRARANAPHTSRVTCEVDNLDQIREALEAGAEVILLDNFDEKLLRQGVAAVAGRALVEVSGGVTLESVAAIARAGVDVISVGALTHSAPAADLGLDWVTAS
jgi:nicotinate-nucleotide pyrophosphorylase (carboxylating)